jgi:hypothetical protein
MDTPVIKLFPRNVAALRRGQSELDGARLVSGNPISTRLESGIGNCFPGLECDLRNLERRFFPGLEVDILDNAMIIVDIDMDAAQAANAAGQLSKASVKELAMLLAMLRRGEGLRIRSLKGHFGRLGAWTLSIEDLGPVTSGKRKPPPDAWTAVRLLPEGSRVTIEVRAQHSRVSHRLVGRRARYLDDKGALAAAFLPGEMTQSLCSPWTHDFRDCGCFYWASNHPDIVKPPLPADTTPDPRWNAQVPWERADRALDRPPPPATQDDPTPVELDHYEINQRWQELNFVIGGREIAASFTPGNLPSHPLKYPGELTAHLRYAAGVELGVIQEYLAAAFSLRSPEPLRGALRANVTAAHAELMRIAISEMRHLRAVNDVLRAVPHDGPFQPALRVARKLPGPGPGQFRPLRIDSANRQAIDAFIDIEKPSASVDGLYSHILATLMQHGHPDQQHAVRTIMAEGEDHFETFQFIREWLRSHEEVEYLRATNMQLVPRGEDRTRLQNAYRQLLQDLYAGYLVGFPEGAKEINRARDAMVALPSELRHAIDTISNDGHLIAFDPIRDSRFAPLDPP